MSTPSVTNIDAKPRHHRASIVSRLARQALFTVLNGLQHGTLAIREQGQVHKFGGSTSDGHHAEIEILDPDAYAALLLQGSVGVGQSYARGQWTSDDLVGFIQLMARNVAWLERYRGGWSRLAAPFLGLAYALRRNTKKGSRRNIAAHYDLSNEFFQTFLDETMTYSAGLFESPSTPLVEASRAKLDRVCRRLNLSPQDHVLEIGTGWGSFAIHAARNYGCRVTTTTISENQYALAGERIARAKLGHRIDLRLEDYRDLNGSFDKLVSIEMVEAVGHEFHDTYFSSCSQLLKSGGAMLLQAILIRDELYDRARNTVDFIKHSIFPGGCLPSQARIRESIARVSDLSLLESFDLSSGYAETLRHWRGRFLANDHRLRQLGFDAEFRRLWEFYFAYCEGGFREGRVRGAQMLLAKPHWQPAAVRGAAT